MANAASNSNAKKVRKINSLDEVWQVGVIHWFLAGSHVLCLPWLAAINRSGASFRDDPSMIAGLEPQPIGRPPLLFA